LQFILLIFSLSALEPKEAMGWATKRGGEQSLAGSFWTTQQPETDIARIDR